MNEAPNGSKPAPRVLPLIFLGASLLIVAWVFGLGFQWIAQHPYGTGWDETNYIHTLRADVEALKTGSPAVIAKQLWTYDRIRPPAHRLMTSPALVVTGVSPRNARLVSVAWYVVALGFFAAAAHRVGGPVAAGMALTLIVIGAHTTTHAFRFGTETPLMLSLGITLWAMVHIWAEPAPRRIHWLMLTLGLALGILSKLTFAPLMVIPVVCTIVWCWRRRDGRFVPLLISGFASTLIALLWYGYNARPAASYARYASRFERHNMEDRWDYPALLARAVLGEPLTLMVAGLVLLFILRRVHARQSSPSTGLYLLAWVLIAAPILALFSHVAGLNHNPRFMGPVLILSLFGLALLGYWSAYGSRLAPLFAGLFLALAVTQVGWVFMARPSPGNSAIASYVYHATKPGFVPYPQWDWGRLHQIIADDTGEPVRLAYLGLSPTFNRPHIKASKTDHDSTIMIESLYEPFSDEPEFDLDDALDRAADADYVLTAPGLLGDQHSREILDNAHNASFAKELEEDPRFDDPYELRFNGTEPVTVMVFRVRESE